MSFSLTRGSGTQVTFHVRYDGAGIPSDVHIVLLDPKNPSIDHATRLIDYPHIPEEFDPKKGFDIPFSTNPPAFPFDNGKLVNGTYTFALVWTFGVGTRRDETDPDQPTLVQPPLEVYEPVPSTQSGPPAVKATNLHVDIKLIFWIPYHGNSFPLPTRYLPKSTGWEAGCKSEEERLAVRAMLATGNPTPPDGFPTAKDWAVFQGTKEYRGIAWYDLYTCCPNEQPKLAQIKYGDAGYTPPSCDIPEDPAATLNQRLTDYHGDHQNIGSVSTGLVLTPGGDAIDSALTKGAVPNQYRDAVKLIRKLCPPTDESYSQGEKLGPTQSLTAQCLSGAWSFFVRVGKAHNLLNYALCGKLIRFQGGTMNFKLCCDGVLRLQYRHSAIPSWRLYLNNRKVAEYDMLTATWPEVEGCYYTPNSGPLDFSIDALESALKEEIRSGEVKTWENNFNITPRDDCPGDKPPDEWLYDAT